MRNIHENKDTIVDPPFCQGPVETFSRTIGAPDPNLKTPVMEHCTVAVINITVSCFNVVAYKENNQDQNQEACFFI